MSGSGDAADGTYTITGGCANGNNGTISGRRISLTSAWTGMMGAVSVRLDMVMAAGPDAEGNFNVSGTATFSGTSCLANAQISRRARGRIIFPDIQNATQRMELIAEVWHDLSAMKVTWALVQGSCPELQGGDTTLFRQ